MEKLIIKVTKEEVYDVEINAPSYWRAGTVYFGVLPDKRILRVDTAMTVGINIQSPDYFPSWLEFAEEITYEEFKVVFSNILKQVLL